MKPKPNEEVRKKKKYKKKYKKGGHSRVDKKTATFILLAFVWCVDFFTTIIALAVLNDGRLYEANPIMAWLMGFGVVGWMIAFIFGLSVLWLLTSVADKIIKRVGLKEDIAWFLVMMTFVILELMTITNNIINIRGIL
jgi:hypothetical protein